MAAITDPLVAAALLFCLAVAAARLFQPAGYATEEMNAKMFFQLLLGPICFAVLILVLDGVANHLYLVARLQP